MSTSYRPSRNPGKISRLDSDGDRITNLDQNVVSHILSRLPTRDSVRTSILSRAWKNKWTYSYNVDICDYDKYLQNPNKEALVNVMDKTKMGPLINLMDRILLYCRYLTSFRFACFKSVDPSRMQTWISDALRHNLEIFEVICQRSNGIVFPCSLLNSVSLQKLNLQFQACTLNVVSANCAPNLTTLDLHRVEIVNENPNASTVTFTFPSLETFTAKSCKWLSVEYVEIHAPSLTTFMSAPQNIRNEEYDYSFVIVAPRLNKFECSHGLPEKFILDGSSIISASFRSVCDPRNSALCRNIGLRVRNLLEEFTNLEDLKLSNFIVEVLRLAPPLGRHDKLRQLTLLHEHSAEQLFELLHAAPMLKILSIIVVEWVDYDYGAMESIPSCVASHLEEVHFRGFCPKTPQYNLAKFFMEKGEQLKKFCIDSSLGDKREHIKELLLTFPKRSAFLDIDVCIGGRPVS